MANKIETMTISVGDMEIDVDYIFYKGRRGMRDSLGGVRGAGPALEPDEPAHVEIMNMSISNQPIDEYLAEKVMEELEEKARAAYEDEP